MGKWTESFRTAIGVVILIGVIFQCACSDSGHMQYRKYVEFDYKGAIEELDQIEPVDESHRKRIAEMKSKFQQSMTNSYKIRAASIMTELRWLLKPGIIGAVSAIWIRSTEHPNSLPKLKRYVKKWNS